MNHAPKEFPYTLKDGANRTGYNLHYFRRMCKDGKFACTPKGRHIFFSMEQYLALPEARISLSIFQGLDMRGME